MKPVRAVLRLMLRRAYYMAHRRRLLGFLCLIFNSLLALPVLGSAGPFVSGNVELIAAPPSVVLGALESNSFVRLFAEQTAILLNQNISVDITQPGIVTSTSSLTPGQISANSLVDSYLLHADAIGAGQQIVTYQGTVTFDNPIVGILVRNTGLNATDGILGSATTVYNPTTVYRGFDGPGFTESSTAVGDSLQLSADFRTISFVLKTESQYDQIRVITASVPEPASIGGIGVLLAVVDVWRRRRGHRLGCGRC